eukprot:7387098-Prymnesium_polylepis.1
MAITESRMRCIRTAASIVQAKPAVLDRPSTRATRTGLTDRARCETSRSPAGRASATSGTDANLRRRAHQGLRLRQPDARCDGIRFLDGDLPSQDAILEYPCPLPVGAPPHPFPKVGVVSVAANLHLAVCKPKRPGSLPPAALVETVIHVAVDVLERPTTVRLVVPPLAIVYAAVGVNVRALAVHLSLLELARVRAAIRRRRASNPVRQP